MDGSRQDQQLRSDQADGSIIAELYESGGKCHRKGEYVPERYPTNREVASAIEKQVAVSHAPCQQQRFCLLGAECCSA